MEGLARSNDSLRLRKIDVGSWSSPVARQHGIESLPSLVLYEGDRLVTSDLRAAFAKAKSL
ncbi:MAG: hypothetical protein AAGB93_21815 [Planctomycetota bacterium]